MELQRAHSALNALISIAGVIMDGGSGLSPCSLITATARLHFGNAAKHTNAMIVSFP
jgi:hypothetical protein